jgi:hypothetical protein
VNTSQIAGLGDLPDYDERALVEVDHSSWVSGSVSGLSRSAADRIERWGISAPLANEGFDKPRRAIHAVHRINALPFSQIVLEMPFPIAIITMSFEKE